MSDALSEVVANAANVVVEIFYYLIGLFWRENTDINVAHAEIWAYAHITYTHKYASHSLRLALKHFAELFLYQAVYFLLTGSFHIGLIFYES